MTAAGPWTTCRATAGAREPPRPSGSAVHVREPGRAGKMDRSKSTAPEEMITVLRGCAFAGKS